MHYNTVTKERMKTKINKEGTEVVPATCGCYLTELYPKKGIRVYDEVYLT